MLVNRKWITMDLKCLKKHVCETEGWERGHGSVEPT